MHDYRAEIEQHEDEINELISAVHETFKRRETSPHAWKDWKSATARLHSHGREFYSLLKRCWTEGIEQDEDLRVFAFSYLATDPYFFRSGYLMERLVRRLKKPVLSESEQLIIRELILRRIDTKALRNFRDICRLIPKVETEGFRQEINARLKSDNSSIRHRAELAASYLPTQKQM